MFVDDRLTAERGNEATDVLRKDLNKAARKLPKAARVVLRKNVDLFMSKDFFYDEATSRIFNRTLVEMRNLYFLFKKWPRENQQGFVQQRFFFNFDLKTQVASLYRI